MAATIISVANAIAPVTGSLNQSTAPSAPTNGASANHDPVRAAPR